MNDLRAPALTEYEKRYCTPGAQAGILLVRGLPDELVLSAARDDKSDSHAAIHAVMGPSTNPSWITAQCAETAYDRGLIDAQELDWITR